jgi:hypothetical protein
MNINMGGIATLAFDSGTGGYGANAVDNIVPTAWEEIDYGFSTGITDVGGVSKSKGVVNLTVKAPGAGTGFSISYVGRMGGGHISDGATSGDTGQGAGLDVVVDLVDYSAAHFGLRWGFAAELEMPEVTCERVRQSLQSQTGYSELHSCGKHKDNPYAGTMYYKMQLGPLHVGTQATFKNPQLSADSAVMNKRSIVAGGALVFGNTLSLSYGQGWDKYRWNDRNRGFSHSVADGNQGTSYGVNPLEITGRDANEYSRIKFRGISAALNMGPVALKAVKNKVGGMGENAQSSARSHSEINLSIAF